MFKIKIADFVIEIDNKYSFIERQCTDYLYEGEEKDFSASCTEEDISNEERVAKEDPELDKFLSSLEPDYRRGYLESVCVYRAICLQLPEKDAFIMHAAVCENFCTFSVDGVYTSSNKASCTLNFNNAKTASADFVDFL